MNGLNSEWIERERRRAERRTLRRAVRLLSRAYRSLPPGNNSGQPSPRWVWCGLASELVGVSRDTIYAWVTGRRVPDHAGTKRGLLAALPLIASRAFLLEVRNGIPARRLRWRATVGRYPRG